LPGSEFPEPTDGRYRRRPRLCDSG
jgi:hypothetical protein